jgi:dTDP-4-amino-4,6-dideoxygalactose transaminase
MTIYMKNKLNNIQYENLLMTNEIYFNEFCIGFNTFLNSGHYILGDYVKEFEKKFSNYISSNYCLGVGNGYDALTIMLKSTNMRSGGEIIVPANTYIATINSIILAGFKPVLVDPSINTYNIEPENIIQYITKSTVAIILVHLYGNPCKVDDFLDICKSHNILLFEDCAQAHGAEYNNTKVGSKSELSAFSFYPTKNIGALGDAGCITFNDLKYYDRITSLRNYGSKEKYIFDEIGFNSRLDELQAMILVIKLKHYNDLLKKKISIANRYNSYINNNLIIKPQVNALSKHVYHIYSIRCEKIDNLRFFLNQNQIGWGSHYPIPPHQQKSLKNIVSKEFYNSELISKTQLSLPINPHMTNEEVEYIINVLNSFK